MVKRENVIKQIENLIKEYENMKIDDIRVMESVCRCIYINYVPAETLIFKYYEHMKDDEIVLLRTIKNFVYEDRLNILYQILKSVMIRKYEIKEFEELELEEIEEIE